MEASKINELPPGFRFHPTDEELVMYYLKNQVASKSCPIPIISEVDIYKFNPWELPEKAEFGEKEWYFFSPRNRKYPNGERPNRATTSGYWKATGTDKGIHSGSKYVGVKKTLVFYQGRPPKGVKTSWIMNEYRLIDSRKYPTKPNASLKLDDWVLCRIHRKRHSGRSEELKMMPCIENAEMSLPATFSLETEHLLNSHVLNENDLDSTNVMQSNKNGYENSYDIDMDKFYLTDAGYKFPDSVKIESNQNAIFSPHILADGVLDFLQY